MRTRTWTGDIFLFLVVIVCLFQLNDNRRSRDALYSARLAVNIALQRLDDFYKVILQLQPRNEMEFNSYFVFNYSRKINRNTQQQ